ncbi:MAG: type II toxin-antitoxin system RelE/ParE family toxin [Planctomycetales bacterium]|nr:type II toxin-antitoxin system RelE/ParE family toxin [Planctomycetales bacterium]
MSLPVIVADEARSNIIETAAWWSAHRSPLQALRWYEGIIDAIKSLAKNAHGRPLARENAKSDHELRELHFGLGSRPTHRVIFVIDSDAVRVLSVRHVAQEDWQPTDEP